MNRPATPLTAIHCLSWRLRVAAIVCISLVGTDSRTFAYHTHSETFYRITFNDEPVGYEYVRTQSIAGRQPPTISCFRKTQLNLKRLGQDLTLQASLWTEQTTDGQLLSFNLQRTDGTGTSLERSGEFNPNDGSYRIQDRQSGTRRDFQLQSDGALYSPIFTTWLPNQAMAATGRSARPVLFPETAGASDVMFEPKQIRQLQLEDRSQINTTRILYYPKADPTNSTTLLVADDLRVFSQEKIQLGGQLKILLTSAEIALSSAAGKSLDLDAQAIIPVDRQIPASSTRKELILELSVDKGLLGAIPQSDFQKVQVQNENSARLTLLRPDNRNQSAQPEPQGNRPALQSTRWMPLGDPVLQRLAAIGAAGETDPLSVCQRLETYSHATLKRSAFSTQILAANQVAKTLRGDCTEHAVFLATLMRINGIPARVATGIAYTNAQLGFSGHMWVEALVNGQWTPFDSTTGLEGFAMTRIKLADSELPDTMESGASLFLPILDLAGRASVRVISAR
ncbi:MAG: transglutaminase-like domain-containing protein [Fuerstiella sp.]